MRLGVNLDHVCTLRQARYKGEEWAPFAEPRLLEAALAAERAGAWQITVHLREDRRHLQDRDFKVLRRAVKTRLNLEMALAREVVELAQEVRPDRITLVPERRQEVTTEGGLDVVGKLPRVREVAARFLRLGIEVSCFVAPDRRQVMASWLAGANSVELHTGAYARALTPSRKRRELRRLRSAAELATTGGLAVYAGHGLTAENLRPVARIPEVEELNIGHSLISRSLFLGLPSAIAELRKAMGA